MALPHNILVPLDLGPHAAEVLVYAAALADRVDAKLRVLHVIAWPLIGAELPASLRGGALSQMMVQARTGLDHLIAMHASRVPVDAVWVQCGDPRDSIITTAERIAADLIVMGTHGRRGVARMWLGSAAEQVARAAPCPVLLVRSGTAT